ncbi:hypothetical protein HELRODRAFT_143362, partial [Helobdella robusta]|uniref:YTH domain-containing protein n=1 Tax=Helobdella robusta TaxID=6412 RepID=T1EJA3_HELRO
INNYNPVHFDINFENSKFFVIKCSNKDAIRRSIRHSLWSSTLYGGQRLDKAFKEVTQNGGKLFLFFSPNGSGKFCGISQMTSSVDYTTPVLFLAEVKWKGQFSVEWIYVKDVPNDQLRHIRLNNNKNKPVTNSRDTQEIPYAEGLQVFKIIQQYPYLGCVFDE